MAYIYKITNDINQKIYIGKTEQTIQQRFKQHCKDAFRERGEKRPLYAAMRKYGVEHFHVEQIEETDSPGEREKYWIEYYGSFKYGYNATMGDDGKRYLDYDLVVATYKELQSMKDTARVLGINQDTVAYILQQFEIQILPSRQVLANKYGKIVNMYDLQDNFIRNFASLNAAAKYMVQNNLTQCKITTIKQHIAEVCNGKRNTAARYKWKYA